MAGTNWYVSNCKDCENIDLSDRWKYDKSKAWCSERREYVNPSDRACSNRFRNDDSKNSPSSEPCYLTTIVCEILGYSDDCDTLTTLRNFRENVMKKDERYKPLLCEYDIVGPMIADGIRNSLKPHDFADFLYNSYISNVVESVKEENYEWAVIMYSYMVGSLKKVFNLNSIDYDKNIEPTGKGYVKG